MFDTDSLEYRTANAMFGGELDGLPSFVVEGALAQAASAIKFLKSQERMKSSPGSLDAEKVAPDGAMSEATHAPHSDINNKALLAADGELVPLGEELQYFSKLMDPVVARRVINAVDGLNCDIGFTNMAYALASAIVSTNPDDDDACTKARHLGRLTHSLTHWLIGEYKKAGKR